VPLCLKTDFAPPLVRDFRYELCWMLRPDFRNLVENNWSLPVRGKKSIDIWKEKTKRLKKMLKGWNINVEGRYIKLKKDLMSKIDILDKKCEILGISDAERIEKLELEWNLKKNYGRRVQKKQTAREKFINEGDENTKFFHLIAKGRKRRVKIPFLIHDGASVNDFVSINKIVSSYYKDLFGPSVYSSINVSNLNMNQLSDIDRSLLTAPFNINEVKKVVFEMKHNSAPGPDGFPAEFFQKFWELIHMDIWNLFKDFYEGNLDIERLNYGMVTLLPKVDNVVDMKNFRPICLLNVCYKIITKVLNNRLASCITKVISDSQYGFMKGRYIMDGVISLNEILHEVKRKKIKWCGP
jgi:hypothetical protein